MSASRHPGGHGDREALREVLHDALADLPGAADPDTAARDVMRALDAYMEDGGSLPAHSARESPVTDFERRQLMSAQNDKRWTLWLVLGAAVATTITVVAVLSGGWPAALAVTAIWVAAILALTIAS
jgi:hypothetical protein